jgi:hypothetical protein
MTNTIASILSWFQKGKKQPVSNKDFHTQLGAHFEEVLEMVQEIQSNSPEGEVVLAKAKLALMGLKDYCYQSEGVFSIPNRLNYLDALCDQIVTNIGCAHMVQTDIVGATEEVDASNWSKFVDGEPILNEVGKIMKGPNYKPPQLYPFI